MTGNGWNGSINGWTVQLLDLEGILNRFFADFGFSLLFRFFFQHLPQNDPNTTTPCARAHTQAETHSRYALACRRIGKHAHMWMQCSLVGWQYQLRRSGVCVLIVWPNHPWKTSETTCINGSKLWGSSVHWSGKWLEASLPGWRGGQKKCEGIMQHCTGHRSCMTHFICYCSNWYHGIGPQWCAVRSIVVQEILAGIEHWHHFFLARGSLTRREFWGIT